MHNFFTNHLTFRSNSEISAASARSAEEGLLPKQLKRYININGTNVYSLEGSYVWANYECDTVIKRVVSDLGL